MHQSLHEVMKCCVFCSYCLVLFAYCTVALQETIRIDWSIMGIQGYLNSPLEVRLGDTIFFNCIPGSFTNVYYLTNETAFRECDGTLEPYLFLVGSCINDANTNLSYPVTVNENSDVVSNFQFRSNTEFYFVSFSNGSTLTDAVSEVVRGGECLQGLKMILRVNPAPTPDIFSIDPTTDSGNEGGLSGSDSPTGIPVIITAVAVSLSVMLVLVLVLVLVVVCVCVICSRRNKRKLMAINDCEKQNQDSKTDEVSSKKVSGNNNKSAKSKGVNDKSNGITVTAVIGDDPPLKSNNAKLPPITSGNSSSASRNKPTKGISKSTARTTSTPSNTVKNGSSRSTSNSHSKTTNGSSGPNPKPDNDSSTTVPKATTTRTSTSRTGSVSQPKPRRSAPGVPSAGQTSQNGATSRGRKGTSESSTRRNKRVGATKSLPVSTGQGNSSGRGKHSNNKGHETPSLPPSSLSGPPNRTSVSRKNNKPESSSGPASRGSVSTNNKLESRSPHIRTNGGGTIAIQNETTVGYRK